MPSLTPGGAPRQRGVPGLLPAADDGLPCDRCPILNLGEKYPVGDERDPWRRMPNLFIRAQALFGRGMFNHASKSRLELERRMGHYCRVMRERHGPCSTNRMRLCVTELGRVLYEAKESTELLDQRRARAYARITWLANDDTHHERVKATRVGPAAPGIRVPPISLDGVLESAPDA